MSLWRLVLWINHLPPVCYFYIKYFVLFYSIYVVAILCYYWISTYILMISHDVSIPYIFIPLLSQMVFYFSQVPLYSTFQGRRRLSLIHVWWMQYPIYLFAITKNTSRTVAALINMWYITLCRKYCEDPKGCIEIISAFHRSIWDIVYKYQQLYDHKIW